MISEIITGINFLSDVNFQFFRTYTEEWDRWEMLVFPIANLIVAFFILLIPLSLILLKRRVNSLFGKIFKSLAWLYGPGLFMCFVNRILIIIHNLIEPLPTTRAIWDILTVLVCIITIGRLIYKLWLTREKTVV